MYFCGTDPEHGAEPWMWSPETQEAALLADLLPGTGSSSPAAFYAWNGAVYFSATTQEFGREMCTSDGTTAGTRLHKDINFGPGDSKPHGYIEAFGDLYLVASDFQGEEIHQVASADTEPRALADIRPGGQSANIADFSVTEDKLFFTADDGTHGPELWWLSAADAQTPRMVADLYPGSQGAAPRQICWLNPSLGFFIAKTPQREAQPFLLNTGHPEFIITPVEMPHFGSHF